jgi:hypothetical protein
MMMKDLTTRRGVDIRPYLPLSHPASFAHIEPAIADGSRGLERQESTPAEHTPRRESQTVLSTG